ETLKKALDRAIRQEKDAGDPVAAIFGETAHGVMKAVDLLSQKYDYVVTNVPYVSGGKHGDFLKDFCKENYFHTKNDIATVFLDRCFSFCKQSGKISMVMPQNWLFLPSYTKFRESLVKKEKWDLIARLGPKAFQTPMWDFNVLLLIMSHTHAPEVHQICGLDLSEERDAAAKAEGLLDAEVQCVGQAAQLKNPGLKISLQKYIINSTLSDFANVHYGSKPGQTYRVTRYFWEVTFTQTDEFWMLMESSPSSNQTYSGKSEICYSLNIIDQYRIREFGVRGSEAWNKQGIIISKMNKLPFSIYTGKFFDNNTCVISLKREENTPAIICSMEKGDFLKSVRLINQKLSIEKETLENTPFNIDHWTKVAEEQYPHGLPDPYSDDPTQWLFHGHPCGSVIWDEETKQLAHGPLRTDGTVLHVAIARLLGYRWPAETDSGMELAAEAREWVQRCDALLPFADDDGIAGIPSLRGEGRLVDRLRSLLAAAYGTAWSPDMENELLRA
ncbi:MAG: SAM-dependent DNA methyltransferase, partial [Methanocalculus sp. MSAO_Arc2]